MSLRVTDDEYMMLQRRTGKVQSDTPNVVAPKKNKYGAVRKEVDGHVFHSAAEARRYQQLKVELDIGLITGLELQKRFQLKPYGVHVCDYVADFYYWRNGVEVIEDVKGYKTDVYRIKKKLVKACIWKDITEISTRR